MNMYRKTHTKQQKKNDELTHATTDPRLTIIPLILYICVDKTTRIDLIHYYIYYKILYSYRRIDLGLFNDLGLFFFGLVSYKPSTNKEQLRRVSAIVHLLSS